MAATMSSKVGHEECSSPHQGSYKLHHSPVPILATLSKFSRFSLPRSSVWHLHGDALLSSTSAVLCVASGLAPDPARRLASLGPGT